MLKKSLVGLVLLSLIGAVAGCGKEGPLGNNEPQGRPDWMKKKETSAPAQPEAPQKQ